MAERAGIAVTAALCNLVPRTKRASQPHLRALDAYTLHILPRPIAQVLAEQPTQRASVASRRHAEGAGKPITSAALQAAQLDNSHEGAVLGYSSTTILPLNGSIVFSFGIYFYKRHH